MIQFFDTNVIVQAQTNDFSLVAEPQREQERHKANDCRLIEAASDDAWMSSVTAFELLLFRSQRGVTIREAALDSVAAAVAASIGADAARRGLQKVLFANSRSRYLPGVQFADVETEASKRHAHRRHCCLTRKATEDSDQVLYLR